MDAGKITPSLLAELEAAPGAYQRAYILLAGRVHPREMEVEFRLRKAPIEERVYELIAALRAKAEATQPAMLAKMKGLPGIRPESFRPLWITNIIYFEGGREAIATLSLDPAVEEVGLNGKVEFERKAGEICLVPAEPNSTERGLIAIGAPQLWAMGYTGYGRRALIIDTGQDPTHPALHNQFLYHYRDIGETWRGNTAPEDCDNHGSHVTGTVLGIDRIERDTIGVAFDAKWMGGIGLGSGCSGGTDDAGINDMLQWALDPDGDPSTTGDMPDVINNSWRDGDDFCGEEGVFEIYDALYAAGIAVVFSAGNDGPGHSTITPPKFNNWDTVRLFAVGALDGSNDNLPIAEFSSRGPSICEGEGSLLIKPEVSAPGVSVRSSVPGGYSRFDGTSMAAPHVSGAILLLKQAFPYLTGEELMLALYYSCTDLGEPGEDNNYGMGIINVPAAFEYLLSRGYEPEPPLEAPNDIILLRVDAPVQNCGSQAFPSALVQNNGTEPVASLQFKYAVKADELYVQEYTWEGELPPGATQEVRLAPLEAPPGEYELEVEVTAANEAPDLRAFNNRLKRKVRIVEEEKIPARAVGDVPVCRNGNALVESLYEGQASFEWYDAEQGGNLLGWGRSLLAPVEEEGRTVFAQVTLREKVGLPDKEEGGSVQLSAGAAGLRFDAYAAFTLQSVKVYAEQAGSRLVRISGPDGFSATKVVAIPEPGEIRVELGFQIEPGEGYELELRAGRPLSFNIGGTAYPYEVPGIVSIKSSTGGPAFYYYFYDWEIEYDHFCGRTPVSIPVAAGGQAPYAGFIIPESQINLAEHSGALNFANESSGAVSWLWNFGDGAFSTEQNPVHTYVDTGRYQVSLTVVGSEGCSSSAVGSIVVIEDAALTGDGAPARGGNHLSVFPNPTRQTIFLAFELEKPAMVRYRLADLLGRPLLQGQMLINEEQAPELSLAELPAGAYLLVVDIDGQRLAQRVVKSR